MNDLSTINGVQAELDLLVYKMGEKGLPNPRAEMPIKSEFGLSFLHISWDDIEINEQLFYFGRGDTAEAKFKSANDWLDEQMDGAERDASEFRKLLAQTIEKGRAIGVEENIMAGVVELSKRLSENVITDQSNDTAN